MQWDDINFKKTPYDSSKAYAQSKLANILFTKELARRLGGSGVTAYALHPGVVATELWRHMGDTNGCIGSLVAGFVSWLCKTPEAGAQTSIFCAVDESITDHSGRYYSDCKLKRTLPSFSLRATPPLSSALTLSRSETASCVSLRSPSILRLDLSTSPFTFFSRSTHPQIHLGLAPIFP